jgi:uncharacterized membrane protein (DUF2068 family)
LATVSDLAIPTTLRIAAALVLVEGLALIGWGAVVLVAGLDGDAVVAVSTGMFFAVYGAALVLAARGLWQRAGWARSLAVVAQLIQLGIAWNLREEPTTALAAALAVVAVGVIAALLSASAGAQFED